MADAERYSKTTYVTNGCSNHSNKERDIHDYYATPLSATEDLLRFEKFSPNILECSVGGGHIAIVLEKSGYKVKGADIIDRGFHDTEIKDYINSPFEKVDMDIVTNPPYKFVKEFWSRACESITEGHKVAFFLKLTFLEGQSRKKMFEKYPPSRIHVFSKRVCPAMNAEFDKYPSSAIAYAWFVYDYGNKDKPVVDWI